MKIDFSQTIKVLDSTKAIQTIDPAYEGDPRSINPPPPTVDLTLQTVAIESVLGQKIDGQSTEDKVRAFGLAQRIIKNKTVDLEVEEIVMLKKCIGGYYSALIVGQSLPMLEGK